MSKHGITIEDVTPSLYESHIKDSHGADTRILFMAGARREYVSYDKIPKDLINAVIAIEDKRYYRHHGIDPRGIVRSFVLFVCSFGKVAQGGSTITQQLIKNMRFTGWINGESFFHKIKRKIPEQFMALKLEKLLTKEEILERYLNAIYFGGGCYGVQASSKYFFNKPVQDLTLPECVLLAGIPNKPNWSNPLNHPEHCVFVIECVARCMCAQGYISQEQYQDLVNTDIAEQMTKRALELKVEKGCFTYHEDSLITQVSNDLKKDKSLSDSAVYKMIYSGGLTIETTQNTTVQDACDKLFAQEGLAPDGNIEAALLLIDPNTGEVLAEEGGLGKKNASRILSRAIDAKRNADILPVKRFFNRAKYPVPDTVSLRDLMLAYSAYDRGFTGEHLSYYRHIYDMNGNLILTRQKGTVEEHPDRYPLPDVVELPMNTDLWVVGKVNGLLLGVWCGYDNNRYIPLEEKYYTFARKIWNQVKTYIEEEGNEERD